MIVPRKFLSQQFILKSKRSSIKNDFHSWFCSWNDTTQHYIDVDTFTWRIRNVKYAPLRPPQTEIKEGLFRTRTQRTGTTPPPHRPRPRYIRTSKKRTSGKSVAVETLSYWRSNLFDLRQRKAVEATGSVFCRGKRELNNSGGYSRTLKELDGCGFFNNYQRFPWFCYLLWNYLFTYIF